MNPKWCFSVLITILTLFGIQQSQITLPNQEIIVQFSDDEITSEEAHNAVTIVKEQLQFLGANNIQVEEGASGIYKISYYSDSDVASIKKIFSDDKDTVKLDYANHNQNEKSTDFPFDKDKKTYNLDVFEIQNASDADWDLEGISIIELKSENHRFFNPNVYASIESVDDKERVVKIALKVSTHIAIAIDNTSYKIPEVRAGPIALGNS